MTVMNMVLWKDKIEVRQGSWFDPLKDVEGELSGLVCNPPYIPSEDIDGLQAEVSKHEPRLALDGGDEGLNDLIHLCCGAASMLKPGGFFAFEVLILLLASLKVALSNLYRIPSLSYQKKHNLEKRN